MPETGQERSKRHHQRTLFDGVAQLYEDTRPGYPRELIEWVTATAGLRPGSAVLEIGCGTGQLTERLAGSGFRITAIDIGASMITLARNRVADPSITFQVSSFEDLTAADGGFDLVICGSAFHWIDPDVRFAKAARLLAAGGWLALLGNTDRYDEPLDTTLEAMWAARGDTCGAWVKPVSDAEAMTQTGLFGAALLRTGTRRETRSADAVIGVENTRAISLSWPDHVRRGFNEELRRYLHGSPAQLTVETTVTMAPVL